MRCGRWAKVAKFCLYALGLGNLVLLVLGEPTILPLVLAVVLAPLSLALALKLMAVLACSLLSLALGDRRERTELLVYAIGGLQPPSASERYREAMLAEVSAALSDEPRPIRTDLLRPIQIDLLKNAPRTILGSWGRLPRLRWKPARNTVGSSTERPGS